MIKQDNEITYSLIVDKAGELKQTLTREVEILVKDIEQQAHIYKLELENVKLQIRHLKKMFDQKNKEVLKALTLQAKEYERRLNALNHEAEQLKEMQATYLRQEIFNEFKKTIEGNVDTIDGKLQGLVTSQATQNGRLSVLEEFKKNTEIQLRDLTDTKATKSLVDKQAQQIVSLNRLVNIAIGGLIVLQLVLNYFKH